MKSSHTLSSLRFLSAVLLAAIILAACAPAAATPTTLAATAAAQPTPAGAPTETPKAAAATSQPGAAGKTTYKIIPGESKVTYEVGETFLNQSNRYNLAKGVTTDITGEVYGDKANPTASSLGSFVIDISKFKSDSDRRDGYIRSNGLESGKYPTARFVPGKLEALPSAYQDGSSYTFKVTGDLTIKSTTKPVTWDVTTKLVGDTLSGQATTELLMSQFNVGPITILGVLNTEDQVKLIFDFVARP